jgi:glycosyltransferase involved in cell wall biosynthesis
MRIVHVIESLDPRTGGPPAVAARLASAQAALGHQVTLAAVFSPEHERMIRESLAGIPGIQAVSIVALPPTGGPLGGLLLGRLTRAVAEHARSADVVHIHGVWDRAVRAAAAAARARRVRYVVVPHGMLDPWSMRASPLKRVKKGLAMALVFRRILNRAAFFHTLNADEKDLIAPLGLAPPCEVIPNGVFLDEFADLPARGEFRAAHPELGRDPLILFLSRLHHKKGLDYLADAFAILRQEHPALRLVVAGPDGGERAPFESRCRSLGIADRVHLVGALYGRSKLTALVDCDVFCLPSRQEGFSMAITEALACGRPVVISRACHFPEVARAGAGRVVDLDAQGVAKGLHEVLSGDGQAMGREGRRLVEANYTWPVIARRTIEAYERHGVVEAPVT